MGNNAIINTTCVSGLCVAAHNHNSTTEMGVRIPGSSICGCTITAPQIADNAIESRHISSGAISGSAIGKCPATLATMTCDLLQACSNGCFIGIKRTADGCALMTFDSATNTIPKIILNNDTGSRLFGLGISESGAYKEMQLFLPTGTTNSVGVTLGFGGQHLLYATTGTVCIGDNALYINTATGGHVGIGSCYASCASLYVAGNILANYAGGASGGFELHNNSSVAQSVVKLTCNTGVTHNVLKIGEGCGGITCMELYGGGSPMLCISAAGMSGGASNWSGDVTVGGAAPVTSRLYVKGATSDATAQALLVQNSGGNTVLCVRNDGTSCMCGSLTVGGTVCACSKVATTCVSSTGNISISGGNLDFGTNAFIRPTDPITSKSLCIIASNIRIYGTGGSDYGTLFLPLGQPVSGEFQKGAIWMV
jgi:hypothetical protein